MRIIARAMLGAIAVVDSGAYPAASVEARFATRARSGFKMRATVPAGPETKLRVRVGAVQIFGDNSRSIGGNV